MKREVITYPKIKQIRPLVWCKCRFCNKEFKWEKGYRIEEGFETNFKLTYCCNECGSNKEDIKILLNYFKNRIKKVPPPPIQPKASL